MPKLKAVVDAQKCHPETCPEGQCLAVRACPKRILRQDAPHETPYTIPDMCMSCFDCLKACPRRAIRKM